MGDEDEKSKKGIFSSWITIVVIIIAILLLLLLFFMWKKISKQAEEIKNVKEKAVNPDESNKKFKKLKDRVKDNETQIGIHTRSIKTMESKLSSIDDSLMDIKKMLGGRSSVIEN